MTKKEALEICIKMWNWLAEHPLATKDDAIDALDLPPMQNDCAACHYALAQRTGRNSICNYCPVWDSTEGYEVCLKEEYGRWLNDEDGAAKAIADRAQKKLDDLLLAEVNSAVK